MKGLVIRYFDGGYFLCDGKAPKGKENDGEIYVGNEIKWFKTWEEADTLRKIIDAAYTDHYKGPKINNEMEVWNAQFH